MVSLYKIKAKWFSAFPPSEYQIDSQHQKQAEGISLKSFYWKSHCADAMKEQLIRTDKKNPQTMSKHKAAIFKILHYYFLKRLSIKKIPHIWERTCVLDEWAKFTAQWLMGLLWSYLMYCVITCINTICQLQSA